MALFDYPRYHITRFPDQRLVIEESQKGRWFNTFELCGFFVFINYVMMRHGPDNVFQSWYFQLMVLVVVGLLRVIWAKGYVEIDAFTQKINLNIRHHKLLKPKQVQFEEVSHVRVNHSEWDDDGEIKESFSIQLILKNKACIRLWKLSKKPEAQALWEAVEKASGFRVKHQST